MAIECSQEAKIASSDSHALVHLNRVIVASAAWLDD